MRLTKYLLVFLAAVTITQAVSWVVIYTRPPVVPTIPLTWVMDTFPNGVQVCPGERIDYKVVIRERARGVVYLVSTIDRDVIHKTAITNRESDIGQAMLSRHGGIIVGDTVLSGGFQNIRFFILGDDKTEENDIRTRIDNDAFLVIPDLPPGPYIRKIAAGMYGRPAVDAIRTQKFTIKDDCGDP